MTVTSGRGDRSVVVRMSTHGEEHVREKSLDPCLLRDDELKLLASGNPTAAPTATDPEGGAHGCAPFSDRARMASRKIPVSLNPPGVLLTSTRHFFGDFLCASKESYPPQAEALRLGARTKSLLLSQE